MNEKNILLGWCINFSTLSFNIEVYYENDFQL